MVNDATPLLSKTLSNPVQRKELLERLTDDPEASVTVRRWIEEIETNGDGDFLNTGGGLLGPVWDRIRERLSESEDLVPGTRVGRYQILHTVGAGGMGSVYAAYDPELDRKVAIKILHPATVSGDRAEMARERLRREARALAQLSHPHVVAVHDVGTYEDQLFLAMEFVEGGDAAAWLKERRRSPNEIIDLFLRAGRGLAAAHSVGLVHRDFKPHNLLVGTDGRVRVADFGLARPPVDEGSFGQDPSAPIDHLTRVGTILGTPAYMAPEQLEGTDFDERSDQFAFCVAVWESLFGRRPFPGSTLGELASSFANGTIQEPNDLRGVSGGTIRILKRGLSIDPKLRYPSMDSLLDELERVPLRKRRRRLLGGLAGMLVLIAGLIIWLVNHDGSQVCDGSRALLEGIWDQPTMDQIHMAFIATGRPFAQDTWTTVESALNTYTDAWVDHRRDACEATRLRGEQSTTLMDLRMICLEDNRQELRALIDFFSRADSQVVLKATEAVSNLTPLEHCDDAASLMAKGPLPPDPSSRTTVSTLQIQYSKAKALFAIGKYHETEQTLTPLIEEAETTGYLPLSAKIRTLHARLQAQLSQFEQARTEFREALALAIKSRNDRLAAQISTRLVHLVGSQMGAYEDGHAWAQLARAWFDRIGNSGEFLPLILGYEATIFREEGMTEEATASAQKALESATRIFGRQDPRLSPYLDIMATQLRLSGRLHEALELYLEARALLVSVSGPHHPDILTVLINIGGLYDEMSQPDKAESTLREALELSTEVYGRDHMQTGLILTTLGNVVSRTGRFEEGLNLHKQALTVFETTHGKDSFLLVYPLGGAGEALFRMGRLDEALSFLKRELNILEHNPSRQGLLGVCKLFLAQSMWQSRNDLANTRRLIQEARPDLVDAGPLAQRYLLELDQFARTLPGGLQ